jgi:predicted small lipoprotein YifL
MHSFPHLPAAHAFLGSIAVVFCLLGSACGLKGPLYLPGDKPAAVKSLPGSQKRPANPPAPQSQKKDRDTTVPPIGDTTAPPATSGPDRPETPPPEK